MALATTRTAHLTCSKATGSVDDSFHSHGERHHEDLDVSNSGGGGSGINSNVSASRAVTVASMSHRHAGPSESLARRGRRVHSPSRRRPNLKLFLEVAAMESDATLNVEG